MMQIIHTLFSISCEIHTKSWTYICIEVKKITHFHYYNTIIIIIKFSCLRRQITRHLFCLHMIILPPLFCHFFFCLFDSFFTPFSRLTWWCEDVKHLQNALKTRMYFLFNNIGRQVFVIVITDDEKNRRVSTSVCLLF